MAVNPANSVIRRLQLSVALDGLTVSVGPGACYTPNTIRLISDGTASVTLSSPTISTWYHAYAFQGADGTLALEVVTTAPSAPYQGTARTKTGDATRRYLGSMYVGANGKVRPFRHSIAGDIGNRILFDASTTAGSVPNPLLSGLVATTVQTLALNPILPITAKEAICQIANLSNRYAYISRPGMADPSVTNFQVMAGPAACPIADIMLDDSQRMTVILSATGILGAILAILSGSLTIYSLGYTYDR